MTNLVDCPRCNPPVYKTRHYSCPLCDNTGKISRELDAAYRLRITSGAIFWSTVKEIRKALNE